MQEAARWEYEHDVVPVQDERYSLTFRGLPRSFLTPPSLADPIPGLWIEQDAVTADEAKHLVRHIEESAALWEVDYSRRAQRYGYRYHYDTGMVSSVGSLPDWLQPLAHRIHENGWMESVPDQATVQEYDPGAGISDHVDDRLAFKGTSRLFPCFRRARTGWCCPRSASCGN
jgi:hypothetical protein